MRLAIINWFLLPSVNHMLSDDNSAMLCVPRFQALMRGRRKKGLVHTVCACSVPPGFLGTLEIFVKSAQLLNSVVSEPHTSVTPLSMCVCI